MAWWQYILSVVGAMLLCAVLVPLILIVCHLVSVALWLAIPNSKLKRWLFDDRGQPMFGYIPPWVKARWIKTPLKTNRITAPPEFIPAEKVKGKTPADRR